MKPPRLVIYGVGQYGQLITRFAVDAKCGGRAASGSAARHKRSVAPPNMLSESSDNAAAPIPSADRAFRWRDNAALWFSLGVGLLVMQVGARVAISERELLCRALGAVLPRSMRGPEPAIALQSLGGTSYRATFPASTCASTLQFYFQASSTGALADSWARDGASAVPAAWVRSARKKRTPATNAAASTPQRAAAKRARASTSDRSMNS